MMPEHASQTYEAWRRLWLSGEDSNAIAALRFHGLRGALAIAEAASQVRRLLRASSASMSGGRESRENPNV